jgi:hypothetical protein
MPHQLFARRAHSRWLAATAVALLALGCGPATGQQAGPQTSPVERAFGAGGRINLRLGAGQYTIQNAPEAVIRVAWQTRDPGAARDVSIDVQASGAEATVRTEGPRNGFIVAIGVPARSDLWVRLSAGELTIRGVTGHKDVSAWAGELKIAVGDGAEYRAVNTSVLAGEIQAPSLKGSKGGVFRSFMWNGPGTYDLRAELTAGEIQLRAE